MQPGGAHTAQPIGNHDPLYVFQSRAFVDRLLRAALEFRRVGVQAAGQVANLGLDAPTRPRFSEVQSQYSAGNPVNALGHRESSRLGFFRVPSKLDADRRTSRKRERVQPLAYRRPWHPRSSPVALWGHEADGTGFASSHPLVGLRGGGRFAVAGNPAPQVLRASAQGAAPLPGDRRIASASWEFAFRPPQCTVERRGRAKPRPPPANIRVK